MNAALRAATLATLLLLVSACGGHHSTRSAERTSSSPAPRSSPRPPETGLPQDRRYAQDRDGEPDKRIDVSTLREPEPRNEPRSKYGNRSPYSVLGKTYRVLPNVNGYVERGIASWYGNKFHGYMTSSFEPYDMYQFSAAHKSLPLPSYVRVTNLANGKSVVVRVNDRGPFHENRLIDLSYAAAVRIGIWPAGTGLVEVRAIGPDTPPPKPQVAQAQGEHTSHTPAHEPQIYLQVGAFGELANAERAAQAVERAGLGAVQVVQAELNGRLIRRVRLGPLRNADEADRLSETVRRLGFGKAQVAID